MKPVGARTAENRQVDGGLVDGELHLRGMMKCSSAARESHSSEAAAGDSELFFKYIATT